MTDTFLKMNVDDSFFKGIKSSSSQYLGTQHDCPGGEHYE